MRYTTEKFASNGEKAKNSSNARRMKNNVLFVLNWLTVWRCGFHTPRSMFANQIATFLIARARALKCINAYYWRVQSICESIHSKIYMLIKYPTIESHVGNFIIRLQPTHAIKTNAYFASESKWMEENGCFWSSKQRTSAFLLYSFTRT